jgi:hypothetical protein
MERGRGGVGVFMTVTVLVAAATIAALAPAGAAATDSDLKHSYVLKLDASNGYEIIALAASERADGRGELVLFVFKRDAAAIYAAGATVTATRIEANLGALGEVALDVQPSGRTRNLSLRCPGEGPTTETIEPPLFRGLFEFHGEEGYAEASLAAPREYTRFFVDLVCDGGGGGEGGAPDVPGARLRLHAHQGPSRLTLQVNKNRPGARTRVEVETREKHGRISISRSRTVWAGASAFAYDPLLRTATLAPPAPFAGSASFHRGAAPANRWGGN